jgi:hypothetical protein
MQNNSQILLLTCLLNCTLVYSQSLKRQTTSSSGNLIRGNNITIQQTIGQPFSTQTSYSNNISFRPGFQQPIFKIETIDASIFLKVFPNPASKYIKITSTTPFYEVDILIIQSDGKIVYKEHLAELTTTQIDCERWSDGMYTLSITDKKKLTYSAKVIKHN